MGSAESMMLILSPSDNSYSIAGSPLFTKEIRRLNGFR